MFWSERQPLAVSGDPFADAAFAEPSSDLVPERGACERPGAAGSNHAPDVQVALCGHDARERYHEFGRNRGENVLEELQHDDPE